MVRFIKTCHNMRQICLLLTRGCFWQFLGLGSLKALGVKQFSSWKFLVGIGLVIGFQLQSTVTHILESFLILIHYNISIYLAL